MILQYLLLLSKSFSIVKMYKLMSNFVFISVISDFLFNQPNFFLLFILAKLSKLFLGILEGKGTLEQLGENVVCFPIEQLKYTGKWCCDYTKGGSSSYTTKPSHQNGGIRTPSDLTSSANRLMLPSHGMRWQYLSLPQEAL